MIKFKENFRVYRLSWGQSEKFMSSNIRIGRERGARKDGQLDAPYLQTQPGEKAEKALSI